MDKTIGEVLHELMDRHPAVSEWERAGFHREMLADFSLSYQLGRLTKHELDQIRQYLRVRKASTLRKQELIVVLSQAIKLKAPQLLQVIDEITYDYILDLVENKGLLRQADQIFLGTLLFLQQAGLAFAGEMHSVGPVLVMPREIVDVLAPLLKQDAVRQAVRDNQRLLMAMRGIVAHYGAIDGVQAQRMLEGMGFSVSTARFFAVQFGCGLANGYFDWQEGYLCDKRLMDRNELLLEQRKYPYLHYYPLTRAKAVAMGEQLYLDWAEEHRELFDHLQDAGGLDDDQTSELVAFLLFCMNNGLSSAMLLSEVARLGVPTKGYAQAAEILRLTEAARQHTRLWALKGYTPMEVAEIERRPRLQVLTRDGTKPHSPNPRSKGGRISGK
ncbi:MAG: hypothetical protein ACOX2K_05055 [Bacillota bacterium]|jgi:hypothetical protein